MGVRTGTRSEFDWATFAVAAAVTAGSLLAIGVSAGDLWVVPVLSCAVGVSAAYALPVLRSWEKDDPRRLDKLRLLALAVAVPIVMVVIVAAVLAQR